MNFLKGFHDAMHGPGSSATSAVKGAFYWYGWVPDDMKGESCVAHYKHTECKKSINHEHFKYAFWQPCRSNSNKMTGRGIVENILGLQHCAPGQDDHPGPSEDEQSDSEDEEEDPNTPDEPATSQPPETSAAPVTPAAPTFAPTTTQDEITTTLQPAETTVDPETPAAPTLVPTTTQDEIATTQDEITTTEHAATTLAPSPPRPPYPGDQACRTCQTMCAPCQACVDSQVGECYKCWHCWDWDDDELDDDDDDMDEDCDALSQDHDWDDWEVRCLAFDAPEVSEGDGRRRFAKQVDAVGGDGRRRMSPLPSNIVDCRACWDVAPPSMPSTPTIPPAQSTAAPGAVAV